MKNQLSYYTVNISIIILILFMSVYQIMLYILRKKEIAYFYSSVFCIAASVYISSMIPEPLFFCIFKEFSYNLYYIIHVLSIIIIELFFILFMNSLFKGKIKKYIIIIVIGITLSFTILFLNIYIFGAWKYIKALTTIHFYIMILFFIYLTIIFLRTQEKNKDALIIFIPFSLLSVLALISNNTSDYTKFGWLLFILFLIFRLSLNFTRASARAVTSELNFLQAQIKPHFLYNTLNAVISILRSDSEKASKLLKELSNYLREIFKFKGIEGSVSLERELDVVKSYLYIVTTRYSGRINVEYDIKDIPKMRVPHLILQPIVENAVKHGVLAKDESGNIKISIKEEKDFIHINVSDDGPGIDNELIPYLVTGSIRGSGIGLSNVQKRMETLYGYGLSIESEENKGTSVTLKLPKRGEKDESDFD
jgi:two-component system LytT family sensor kinase